MTDSLAQPQNQEVQTDRMSRLDAHWLTRACTSHLSVLFTLCNPLPRCHTVSFFASSSSVLMISLHSNSQIWTLGTLNAKFQSACDMAFHFHWFILDINEDCNVLQCDHSCTYGIRQVCLQVNSYGVYSNGVRSLTFGCVYNKKNLKNSVCFD